MKIRLFFIAIFLLFLQIKANSQDTISLEKCKIAAVNNYAGTKNIDLFKNAEIYQVSKISAGYLPKLNLNAQATWQSEVTSIDLSGLPFPINIDPPSKDQYKAVLEVSQMIYDGVMTKKLKAVQQAETKINLAAVTVEQNKIEDQINQLYINILYLNKQIELNQSAKLQLEQRLKKAESGVKNGILLETAVNVIKAEILKLEQIQISLKYKKKTVIQSLSTLTGINITENTIIQEIKAELIDGVNLRAEEVVFEFQKAKIDQNIGLLSASRSPKLYSFGQFGYGRPGLNFFSTEFQPYMYIGANLTWNIWDWNQVKNEKANLQVQKELIDVKHNVFVQSLDILRITEKNNIEEYKEAIAKDEEIIALREEITKVASSQLDNGTITATEYLAEVNAEMQARLNLELNKLLLLQAKLNLNFINGY